MKMRPQVLLLLLMGLLASIVLAQQSSTWTDPATGLMWATQDNGNDVTWSQAGNYCANLRLAGYSNWRLPTIDELADLYDETQNVNTFHIKGSIKLSTCCPWSCSTGRASGAVWSFSFTDGKRYSQRRGDSLGRRALCARSSGR
jgi:hypothetical protein